MLTPHYARDNPDREKAEQWRPNPFILETFDSLFQTALGELDFVPFPYGPHGKVDRFTYDGLWRHAVTKTAFGVHIPVAAFEDVVASKLSARREKDLRTLPEIERLQYDVHKEKELDGPWLKSLLLERNAFKEKTPPDLWKSFKCTQAGTLFWRKNLVKGSYKNQEDDTSIYREQESRSFFCPSGVCCSYLHFASMVPERDRRNVSCK